MCEQSADIGYLEKTSVRIKGKAYIVGACEHPTRKAPDKTVAQLHASICDSFTITVLMQLEDLGFCKKGEGGKFVADGNLISGVGKLPFNTDCGGLCNNHPANRGGITKVIEAVRQLRGEAHPAVQVRNCDLDAVRIGQPVRLKFAATADGTPPVPAFTLA